MNSKPLVLVEQQDSGGGELLLLERQVQPGVPVREQEQD